jgi:hypothetical protein
MGFVISMIIGYAVLLWIIGFFTGKEPWTFALKGTGITIALGFLLFFLFILKTLIFQ